MKKLIIAALALTMVAGASVVSFAQDVVETTPTTTQISSEVEKQTPFKGRRGSGGFNRVSDEERAERREWCDSLTEEEREEFFAERGEERAGRRGGCGALTEEEREEFFAQTDAHRGNRRG